MKYLFNTCGQEQKWSAFLLVSQSGGEKERGRIHANATSEPDNTSAAFSILLRPAGKLILASARAAICTNGPAAAAGRQHARKKACLFRKEKTAATVCPSARSANNCLCLIH